MKKIEEEENVGTAPDLEGGKGSAMAGARFGALGEPLGHTAGAGSSYRRNKKTNGGALYVSVDGSQSPMKDLASSDSNATLNSVPSPRSPSPHDPDSKV